MATIQQKFSSLGGAQEFGAAVGALQKVDVTDTETGTTPNGKPVKPVKVTEHIGEYQKYQKGVIAIHTETNKNAFAVHGPMFQLAKWGPGSTLGWPSGDSQQVMKAGKPVGWASAFDAQTLYLKAGDSAAIALSGAIRSKYESLGGPGGWLGFPLHGIRTTADGRGTFVDFEHGLILSGPTGTHEVHGLIRKQWAALGSTKGLGFPLTDELPVPGATANRFSDFEDGVIHWTSGQPSATQVSPFAGSIPGGPTLPISPVAAMQLVASKVSSIVSGLKLDPPATKLDIVLPTMFRLDGQGFTTGYAHNGNQAINRRLRTRTMLKLELDGAPDADITLDLDVLATFDAAKQEVHGTIYQWWYHVHIGWPAGDDDAKKIGSVLEAKMKPFVGTPMKIADATVPAGVHLLSLKTMADGSINVFVTLGS